MTAMRVSLTNLGDGRRVLFDRHAQPVIINVGSVVDADLTEGQLDALDKFKETETLIVGEPGEGRVPDELQAAINMLTVIDFEEYNTLLVQFFRIIPCIDASEMRPTRVQMRMQLRAKIESYVAALSGRTPIHDDEDPAPLEEEQRQQEHKETQPPARQGKRRRGE